MRRRNLHLILVGFILLLYLHLCDPILLKVIQFGSGVVGSLGINERRLIRPRSFFPDLLLLFFFEIRHVFYFVGIVGLFDVLEVASLLIKRFAGA